MRNILSVVLVCAGLGHAEAKARVTVLEKGVKGQDFVAYGEARGEVSSGIRWSDANGENAFFLSRKEEKIGQFGARTLFMSHYVKVPKPDPMGGSVFLVQSGHLTIEGCPEDTALFGDVLGVFDEDRDGRGELVFWVEDGCVSDVSPVSYTLHVWENGRDYALFGRELTCVDKNAEEPGSSDVCREVGGGEVFEAPALADAPKAIRELAKKSFAEHVIMIDEVTLDPAIRKKIKKTIDARFP